MYSGIVLSRYVFTFIPIDSGYANARKLHMICSYWGYIDESAPWFSLEYVYLYGTKASEGQEKNVTEYSSKSDWCNYGRIWFVCISKA